MSLVRSRRARQVLVAVMALTLLSGCARSGSVALIGDQRITERELSQIVQESERFALAQQLSDVSSQAITTQAVTWLVRAALLEQVAAAERITVTKADVDALVGDALRDIGREELQARLVAGGVPPSRIDQYARSFVIQQKLAERLSGGDEEIADVLSRYSDRLGVEIAPRYGTWSSINGSLGPAADDLSRLEGPGSAIVVPKS